MTYYFLENFEKYFLETLVQIESNSQNIIIGDNEEEAWGGGGSASIQQAPGESL